MILRRPRSLNGLVLVGFAFVALPLLLAVIWALVNLDRVAEKSERLVSIGVSAAENNRRLQEHRVRRRVAAAVTVDVAIRRSRSLSGLRCEAPVITASILAPVPRVG